MDILPGSVTLGVATKADFKPENQCTRQSVGEACVFSQEVKREWKAQHTYPCGRRGRV